MTYEQKLDRAFQKEINILKLKNIGGSGHIEYRIPVNFTHNNKKVYFSIGIEKKVIDNSFALCTHVETKKFVLLHENEYSGTIHYNNFETFFCNLESEKYFNILAEKFESDDFYIKERQNDLNLVLMEYPLFMR